MSTHDPPFPPACPCPLWLFCSSSLGATLGARLGGATPISTQHRLALGKPGVRGCLPRALSLPSSCLPSVTVRPTPHGYVLCNPPFRQSLAHHHADRINPQSTTPADGGGTERPIPHQNRRVRRLRLSPLANTWPWPPLAAAAAGTPGGSAMAVAQPPI